MFHRKMIDTSILFLHFLYQLQIFLFELVRHADHHLYANKKYQNLKHIDESPELPYGYPLSIILALIPPLWFKIMNPIVEKM